MNQKSDWAWLVIGRRTIALGLVVARDPRDAVSRALTSESTTGELVGVALGVPLSVLDAAPGNNQSFYEIEIDGCYVSVREAALRTTGRTMLELKALWDVLGDVPIAQDSEVLDDDDIEEAFLHFPVGTPREVVWHWFEAQNPAFVVGEMMREHSSN